MCDTIEQVEYEAELDLSPFVRKKAVKKERYTYSLYAVLVHAGGSVHSGHYYCFVRGPAGIWHLMDDSHVSQVNPFAYPAPFAGVNVLRAPSN